MTTLPRDPELVIQTRRVAVGDAAKVALGALEHLPCDERLTAIGELIEVLGATLRRESHRSPSEPTR